MIVVHQMAKVASMAWVEAARLIGMEALHTHFLTEHNLRNMAAVLETPAEHNTIVNPLMVRTILRKGRQGTADISTARGLGQEIRVITGMRDPVARSISVLSFFADFCGHTGRRLSARDGANPDDVCAVLADLWQSVLEGTAPAGSFEQLLWQMIGSYRTWFDEELQSIFGVDVFSASFPSDAGAQRLRGQGVEVLVYRAEDLAPHTPAHPALLEAAQTFLGAPVAALPRINTAATRRSHALYAKTRDCFHLPPSMLDEIYNLPVVRHFYSASEISAFKSRWSAAE